MTESETSTLYEYFFKTDKLQLIYSNGWGGVGGSLLGSPLFSTKHWKIKFLNFPALFGALGKSKKSTHRNATPIKSDHQN
jgi:hypothetical protein